MCMGDYQICIIKPLYNKWLLEAGEGRGEKGPGLQAMDFVACSFESAHAALRFNSLRPSYAAGSAVEIVWQRH